jgi:predicted O-linked N-acetylglucosamine transferase (SPINDLY family)
MREQLEPRLTAAGIDLARVRLAGATRSLVDHLALYSELDVALDPFPYHGTTTTCEALWMGVPVVSLRGDRHASRVGPSILTAIGHSELIAADRAEYVRIAAALAGDLTRMAKLRQTLRPAMQHSPLLDHAGQSARFGRALRACWRRHCGETDALNALGHVEAAAIQPVLL